MRPPETSQARYSAAALAATLAGVLGLVPALPNALSAVLVIVFVAVGPGCATLAWTGAPDTFRAIVVPALGLAAVVIVTTVSSTVGWWSPRGLFLILALSTAWSVVPNLRALVRDMVP